MKKKLFTAVGLVAALILAEALFSCKAKAELNIPMQETPTYMKDARVIISGDYYFALIHTACKAFTLAKLENVIPEPTNRQAFRVYLECLRSVSNNILPTITRVI